MARIRLSARARDVNGNTALTAPATVNVANATAATPAFVQVNAATRKPINLRSGSPTPVRRSLETPTFWRLGGTTRPPTSPRSPTWPATCINKPSHREGPGLSQAIYYATSIKAAAAGRNTVTVTFNTAAPFIHICVLEYSGLDPVNPRSITVKITHLAMRGAGAKRGISILLPR